MQVFHLQAMQLISNNHRVLQKEGSNTGRVVLALPQPSLRVQGPVYAKHPAVPVLVLRSQAAPTW